MIWSPPRMWRRGIAACAFIATVYGCTATGPLTTPSPDPAGTQVARSHAAHPRTAAHQQAARTPSEAHAPSEAHTPSEADAPSEMHEKARAHTPYRDKSKIGVRTHNYDKAALRHATEKPEPAPLPPLPTEREMLKVADNAMAHVFPPMAAAATPGAGAPIAVMLHGMCGSPFNACTRWRDTPQQHGWLLCPSGNSHCRGHYDWSGSGEEKAQHIDAAVAALRERHGAHIAAEGGDILMGFSRGAFVARDVAYARPGRYRGLVLIGAALKPDAERLKRAGIRRVVLASGDLDGARPTMQLAAGLLRRDGLPARFISLGRVWHTLPQDLNERLREPLAWVAAAPEQEGDS